MFSIIFGDVLDALGGSPSIAALVSQVNKVTLLCNVYKAAFLPQASGNLRLLLQVCLYFLYLAIVSFVASYGEIGLWMWTGTLTAFGTLIRNSLLCTLHQLVPIAAVCCCLQQSSYHCIKILLASATLLSS